MHFHKSSSFHSCLHTLTLTPPTQNADKIQYQGLSLCPNHSPPDSMLRTSGSPGSPGWPCRALRRLAGCQSVPSLSCQRKPAATLVLQTHARIFHLLLSSQPHTHLSSSHCRSIRTGFTPPTCFISSRPLSVIPSSLPSLCPSSSSPGEQCRPVRPARPSPPPWQQALYTQPPLALPPSLPFPTLRLSHAC